MLTIRNAQLGDLRQFAVNRFVDHVTMHLAVEFPRHYSSLGEDGAREFVQRVIRIGAGCEVTTMGAVAVLVELLLQFGERFERSPDSVWANNVLATSTLPDYLRVEAIRQRLSLGTGGRVLVPVSEPTGEMS